MKHLLSRGAETNQIAVDSVMDQASDAGMTEASSTKEHDAATVKKGSINSSNSSSNYSNDHKNTISGGKPYSNQNEEDESAYNSEDFDDHSTFDRESEDDGEVGREHTSRALFPKCISQPFAVFLSIC